jgi:hypothetical protein
MTTRCANAVVVRREINATALESCILGVERVKWAGEISGVSKTLDRRSRYAALYILRQ